MIVDALLSRTHECADALLDRRIALISHDHQKGSSIQWKEALAGEGMALERAHLERQWLRAGPEDADQRTSALLGDVHACQVIEALAGSIIDPSPGPAFGFDDIAEEGKRLRSERRGL